MSADEIPDRPAPALPDAPSADIGPLVAIMTRLRDPNGGCPWDLEQTFATIAPYAIEEAYEVIDAIGRNDMVSLCDELGDLLLQVVFHARMADEAGHFTLQSVVDSICTKMIRRHPHVFAETSADGAQTVERNWEAIKASERAGRGMDSSALAGVALALPALLRAEKLQKRAARTGFDWPDTQGVIAKIFEEIEEVVNASSQDQKEEEVGDLLFAVVNLARHLNVDPESALRGANSKFDRRFRAMENMVGDAFPSLPLMDKEALWQAAKSDEIKPSAP
ncbi:nucleoside triphosphate pyrophosphohydrolase [Sphingobium algorifonticola]|uniref:Nucleoside triphosphate pyrophosphohydrolase n=1 Tax=Sphingobium algorifonticola TaxID=2008318 RepID=A0A437J6K2_9SPHN|nr:nucleoside triphosphate pyrophosphohydrolase [Sphingobium algorifonticola]RVT40704.1 nucleoside triphosphate pyrophosphohydrolase [Sphingobium algorifonticola]